MVFQSDQIVGGWQGVKDVKKATLTVPQSPAFQPRKTRSAAKSSVSYYWTYVLLLEILRTTVEVVMTAAAAIILLVSPLENCDLAEHNFDLYTRLYNFHTT